MYTGQKNNSRRIKIYHIINICAYMYDINLLSHDFATTLH